MAYGLQGTDLFDYQPTVIGFNDKDMMIQFPWGSRYLIKRSTFSTMSLEPINGYFNLSKEVLKDTVNLNGVDNDRFYKLVLNGLTLTNGEPGYRDKLISLIKELPKRTDTKLVDSQEIMSVLGYSEGRTRRNTLMLGGKYTDMKLPDYRNMNVVEYNNLVYQHGSCLLYTSPSPRD